MNVLMDKPVSAILNVAGKPRLRRALYVLIGVILSVLVVAWLGVPSVLRWALETKATDILGRKVSVGRVSFNPLSLTTRLENLRIASADGQSSLLAAARVSASLSWQSLWYRGPVVDAVHIDQPHIHFARTGPDQYSFDDIIKRVTAAGAKSPPGEPARFSVNNIELQNGLLDFDDKPVGKRHRIEGIQIGVPFISNFPARVHVAVVPHLDAIVNGSALRLDGQLRPFLNNNEASLDIRLAPFDLTQYLGYAPTRLPVLLKKGSLDSTLKLVWGQGRKGGQHFVVSGHLGLSKVDIRDVSDTPLLGFDALGLDIKHFEPLAVPLRAAFSKIRIEAPALNVSRNQAGDLNLASLATGAGVESGAPVAPKPAISIDVFEVGAGRVSWLDSAMSDPYALQLEPVALRLQGLDLAADRPALIEMTAAGEGMQDIAFQGRLNPFRAEYDGHFRISGVQVSALRPYYAKQIGAAKIQGMFSAEGDLKVISGEAPQLVLSEVRTGLSEFGVVIPGVRKPVVEIPELTLAGTTFDLNKRELHIATLSSQRAKWTLNKGEQGDVDLLKALTPQKSEVPAGSPGDATAQAEAGWKLSLGEAILAGWGLRFEDRSGSAPVSLSLQDFGLRLSDWKNVAGHRASFELATRVNSKGRLALGGKFASDPLEASIKADLRDVDLLAVQPYVDQHYKVLVTRGNLTGKGKLEVSLANADKPALKFQGDLAINEFSSLDRINDTDFLQWRHFGVTGLAVDLSPLRVAAKELRVDDFYSRLILDAQGRFNLRELAAESGEDPSPEESAPAVASSAPAQPPVNVRLDRLVLTGGAINYSDRFVRPNYDAKLAAVNGTMTDLSSEPDTVALLDLKAALDGSAPVVVSGQLNPLRQDQYLDLHAQVTGIDLTSLSTYSAKYVGYGISKGKLSMDLKYQIRDRKLSAENQLYLDQLTFGEQVESPDAIKLPVLFAVSLLKNRKGEIDINLPIGGSLDDPKFSVGGIVVKVIINLITKAVTAPFSLIGSLFGGGGEELSYLEFSPGKVALSPGSTTKLQSIAKALTDRPALRLDVTGHADPASDLEGVNRGRLEERLRATKTELLVKAGQSVADLDGLTIEPAEYPKLIEQVYKAEKVPNKPRNALGLAKSIPVEEMERLLLGHFAKDAPDLESLASARAKAVRDWLIGEGKVEAERIFLVTAERAGGEKAAVVQSPRVSFALK
jgi:uncharacterized protein involved in outer membrane biogenesis